MAIVRPVIDDLRVGRALRAVRIKRGWTQSEVARRAKVDRSTVSRVERGHLGSLSVDTVRGIAAVVEVWLDLVPRWRGGDLDRLLNSGHSALHEAFAAFVAGVAAWVAAPEVSFSIYGERGVIDVLLWHPATSSLVVVELKTQIVDIQELLGTMDRRLRLAAQIGGERGWRPTSVTGWIVIADGATNRRQAAAHRTVLRTAFPADGLRVRSWLRHPAGPIRAMSFWSNVHPEHDRRTAGTPKRVRARLAGSRRAWPASGCPSRERSSGGYPPNVPSVPN